MADPNVLVVFYSRGGLTERVAVLLAEGAIQGEANIRLRRCRDTMADEMISADAAWRVHRDRMHNEFASPRPDDFVWADIVAFGTPAAVGAVSPELAATLEVLRLQTGISFTEKAATAFTSSYGMVPGAESTLNALDAQLLRLGFTVMSPFAEARNGLHPLSQSLEDYERARVQGRRAAALGRALQSTRGERGDGSR